MPYSQMKSIFGIRTIPCKCSFGRVTSLPNLQSILNENFRIDFQNKKRTNSLQLLTTDFSEPCAIIFQQPKKTVAVQTDIMLGSLILSSLIGCFLEDGYTHSNNAMPIPWNQVVIKDKDGKQRSISRSTRQELTEQSNTTDEDTTDNDEYSSLPRSSADEEDPDFEYHQDSNVNNEFVDALSPYNEDSSKENSKTTATDNKDSIVSDTERTDVLGVERKLSWDDFNNSSTYIRSEGISKNEFDQTPPSSKTSPEETNNDSIQYQKSTAEDELEEKEVKPKINEIQSDIDQPYLLIRNQPNKKSPNTSKHYNEIDTKLVYRDDTIKVESKDEQSFNQASAEGFQNIKSTNEIPNTSNMQKQNQAQENSIKRESVDDSSSRRSSTKTQQIKKSPRTSKDSGGLDTQLVAQDVSSKVKNEDSSSSRRPSTKNQPNKNFPRTSKDSDGIEQNLAKNLPNEPKGEDAPDSHRASNKTQQVKQSPKSSINSDIINPKLVARDDSNKRESEYASRRSSTKNQSNKKFPKTSKNSSGEDSKLLIQDISSTRENVESPRRLSSKDQPELYTGGENKEPLNDEEKEILKSRDQLDSHICKAIQELEYENINSTISSPIICTTSSIKTLTTEQQNLCECEKPLTAVQISVTNVNNENISPSMNLPKTIKEQRLCECEKKPINGSMSVKQIDSDDKWLGIYTVPCAANKSFVQSEIVAETTKQKDSLSICECAEIKVIKPTDRNVCKACVYATQIQSSNSDDISEKCDENVDEMIFGKVSPDISIVGIKKSSDCKCNPEQSTNSYLQPLLKIILPYTDGSKKKNILEIGIRQTDIEYKISNTSSEQTSTSNKRQTGGENKNNTRTNTNDWSSEIVQIPQNSEGNHPIRFTPEEQTYGTELNECSDGWSVTACREHFGEPISNNTLAFLLQEEHFHCNRLSHDDQITKYIQQIERIISKYTHLSGLKFNDIYDKEKMRRIFRQWLNGDGSATNNGNDSSLVQSCRKTPSECRQFIKDSKTRSEIVAMLDYEVLSDILNNNDSFIHYKNELRQSEYFSSQDDNSDIIENPNKCAKFCNTLNISESRKGLSDTTNILNDTQLDCTNNANPSNEVFKCSNASKFTENIEQSRIHQLDCTNKANPSNKVLECNNASKSRANTEQSKKDQLDSTNNAKPSNDVCECCLKSIIATESKTNVSNSKVNNSVYNANTWYNSECNANNSQCKIDVSKHKEQKSNITKSSRNLCCSAYKSSSCNEPIPCTRVSEATIPSINLTKENEFDCQNECLITTQSNTEIISNLTSSPTISGPNQSFTDTIDDKSNFNIPWDSHDYSHFELDCGEEIPGKISSATILSQPIDSFEEKMKGSELKIPWGSDYSHFSKDKECEPVQIISKESEELLLVDSVKKIEGGRWEPSLYKIALSGTRLISSPSCPTLSFTNSSVYGSFNYPCRQTWSEDYSHSTEEADCISVPKAQKSEPLIIFEYTKKEKQVCPTEVPSYHIIGAKGINLKGKCSKSEVKLICPSISALKLFYSCSSIPYDTDWTFKILSNHKSGAKTEYKSCEKFDQLIRGKSSTDYYSLENSYDYLLTPHDSGCNCNACKLKDISATRSTEPPTCPCGFCKLNDCKCATVKVKSRTNSDQEFCKCEICNCEIMDLSKDSRQSCKTEVSTLVEKEVMIQQLETCTKLVSNIQLSNEYKDCQNKFTCTNKMKDLTAATKPLQRTEFETCILDNHDFEIKKKQLLKTSDKLLTDQQTCKCTACQCKTIILRFESKSQQTSKHAIPKLNNWTDVNLPLYTKSDIILHFVSKSQQTSKSSCQILKQQSRTYSNHSSTNRQTANIFSTTKSNDTIFQQNCKCGVCRLVDCKCEIINKKLHKKSVKPSTDRQITNLSSAIKSTNNLVNQTICPCGFCNLVKCKCETVYQQSFSKINDNRNCKCKICQLIDCKCERANQKSKTVLIDQKISMPSSKVRCKCGFRNFLLDECKCETVNLRSTRLKDNQNKTCKCEFCNDVDCKCETAKLHTITRLKDDQNQVYKCEFCNNNNCKCENVKQHSPISEDNQNKNYKCEFCDNVNCKCGTTKLHYATKESAESGMKSYSIKSDQQICTCIECVCETLTSRTPIKENYKSFSSVSKEQVCTCNICQCEIINLWSSKTKITDIKLDQQVCTCSVCQCDTLTPHSAAKSNNKFLEDIEVCICKMCQCENLIPHLATTSNKTSLLEDTACTCSVCQCEIINLRPSSKYKDNTNPQYRLKSGKSDRKICTCKVYQDETGIPRSTKTSNENLFSPLLVTQDCTCGSCHCKKINSQSLETQLDNIKSLSDDRAKQSYKCGVCNQVHCQCELANLGSETRSNDSKVCHQTCTCEFCKLVDCKCETKSKLRIEINSNNIPITQPLFKCNFCNLVDCACETTKINLTIKSNGAPVCEICKLVDCKCGTAKIRSEARPNDGAVCRQICTYDSCKLADCKCEDMQLWPSNKSNDYKFTTAKVCPTMKSNYNLVYQQNSVCADCKFIDCKCVNTKLQLPIKSNVISLYRQSCKCGFCQLVDCKCETGNLHIITTPSSESIICSEVINPNLSTEKKDSKINMPSKFSVNTAMPFKCASSESKARKSKTTNDCLFTNLCPARISSKPDLTTKQNNSLSKICPPNIGSRKHMDLQCEQLNEVSIQFKRKKNFDKCAIESESVLQISNYSSTHSRRSVKITKHGIKSTRSSRSNRSKRSKRGKRQKSHETRKSSERNLSSTTTSTASQTERKILRDNVVTKAMISYENEIRPLKEALYSLQTKIKNLDFIDIGNLSSKSVLNSSKYSTIGTSIFPNLYQSPARPIRECFCPENQFEMQNLNYFSNLEEFNRPITSRKTPVSCVNKTCDYLARKPLQNNAAETSTGVNTSVPLKRTTKTNKRSPTRRKMQMKTESIPMSSNMLSLSQNLPNLKIEPENFILGSTPIKTDPDLILSWKKSMGK